MGGNARWVGSKQEEVIDRLKEDFDEGQTLGICRDTVIPLYIVGLIDLSVTARDIVHQGLRGSMIAFVGGYRRDSLITAPPLIVSVSIPLVS